MNPKKRFAWLVNPFERLAGWPSLLIGTLVIALTVWVGQRNGVVFDGLFGIHFRKVTLMQAFLVQLSGWLFPILIFYLAGTIFSKSSIRLVDVAGTLSLARAPFLLAALIAGLPSIQKGLASLDQMIRTGSFSPEGIAGLWLFLGVTMIVMVWFITLTYQAVRVSCNIQAPKNTVIFIAGLMLSALLAVTTNYFILKKLITLSATAVISVAGPASAQDSTRTEAIKKISIEVVNQLQKGNYEQVTTLFDKTMQEQLSADQLKNAWKGLSTAMGTFQKSDEPTTKPSGTYTVSLTTCHFERGTPTLQLSFDQNNRISGLYFR